MNYIGNIKNGKKYNNKDNKGLFPFYKNERLTESPKGSRQFFIVRGKEWLEYGGKLKEIKWK